MQKRWILASREAQNSNNIVWPEICSVPGIANLLKQKGFTCTDEVNAFLRPRLSSLGDPFLLPQMEVAVTRILRAIDGHERLVIYGDYDVDGVTSLALLNEMLSAYGASPALFLPSRMEEGYGLSPEAIERCWQRHRPQLLIAVDCGTSSRSEVASLGLRGTEVIILDHHEAKGPLPECVAVVNPKAVGSVWSYLCSVGIVFKLCHALLKTRPLPGFDLRRRLDLVALGTVTDIVPLKHENRILVYHGAKEIARPRSLGLAELLKAAAIRPPIISEHIGFRLGPRLNAAGRLTNAEKALRLLVTNDPEEATSLAAELDLQNRERQEIEREICKAAEEKISVNHLGEAPAIVLGESGWHPGVLGIVASRIAKAYHRPTIIVGFDDQAIGKGSGRSIIGLSLVSALAQCGGLLEKFGGHEMAAGLTIKEENFPAFANAFIEICGALLRSDALIPSLRLDQEISLGDFTWELLRWHDLLQPFGEANPQPVFLARNVEPAAPPVVLKERHLLLRLRQNGRFQRAIFFGGAQTPVPTPPWDVAFRIGSDEYEGELRLQLQVEALRAAAPL